jgi:hypothetical protein
VGSVPNIVWAGSTGRRNTAIAVTAVAAGAWANGTGRAGRRNTAILATAGAAVAWSRYNDKRKQEKRHTVRRVVYVQGKPVVRREVVVERRPEVVHREVIVERRPEVVHREVIVERRPEVCREVVYVPVKEKKGKKLGHYIGEGHYKHGGHGHDHDD